MLTPDAGLPVKVSPKVESDFESVRQEVQRHRPAVARPEPAPEGSPRRGDAPVSQVTKAPPPLVPTPVVVAAAPVPSPGVDLKVEAKQSPERRVPTLSWVLLGTGVVAGGVGTLFGIQSRDHVGSAREAELTKAATGHLDEARGQAVVANVLFSTAVAAAAGAVTAYLLDEEPPAAEGRP
ncbi:hypothetical protein D7V93_23875 [Corallococcus llansteffanensis]|uniref:Uncharacterized protein n=2 Tax=Corallococcus llansteffanensis TaxID=2316731 RepID=A0A3A8PIE9_9BACT|nr:hypothetical protein D7V93_23875 [Corallococcus llansteffanensis]